MEVYNLNHWRLVRPAYENRHQPTHVNNQHTLPEDSIVAVVFLVLPMSSPVRVRRHWKQAKLLRRY